LTFKYYHIVPDAAFSSSKIVTVTSGTKIGVLQTKAQIDKQYGKKTDVGPHLHFESKLGGKLYNAEQFLNKPEFKPNQDDVWYNTEFKY